MKWAMKEWGGAGSNRWTITDGRLQLEVHQLINGGPPREEYPDGYIVSPEQATEYAHAILKALNQCEVTIDEVGS